MELQESAPATVERPGAGQREVTPMPEQAYKRCTKCGETKPLDEFHRDSARPDGRRNDCKVCHGALVKRIGERSDVRARRTQRDRKRRTENPGYEREKQRRHAERHPEKAKARNYVLVAVYQGRLQKPEACEDCGEKVEMVDLHGHHEDYSKPYDVEWVCRSCHVERHRTDG